MNKCLHEKLNNGTLVWGEDSQVHREDGPAIIYFDGGVEWCLNGNTMSFKKWCLKVNLNKTKIIELKLLYG